MPFEITREQRKLRARLKPGNQLHTDMRQLIRDRFDMSAKVMSARYEKWRELENQHLAYVDPDKRDKEGKSLFPFARSIVVPYTYAVLDTRLTFFFLAFASKNPIVPILGRGPEDIIPAKLVEVINEYQMTETSALAVLHSWIKDSERYGIGVIKNLWTEKVESKTIVRREPVSLFGTKLFERMTRTQENITTYEGNIAFNVSPFNFFPDPRVPVSRVREEGEFIGHQLKRGYNHLLKKELQEEFFNVKEFIKAGTAQNRERGVSDEQRDGIGGSSNLPSIVGMHQSLDVVPGDKKDRGYHDIKELSIELIPKDHDLSDGTRPEIWVMALIDNETVVQCEPSIYAEFPYYLLESNYDYASPMNVSTVEMVSPMADILSWLFNSHMENVRKIINDVLIVDPSLIELRDLLKGGPAKIIRMKEDAYGLGMMDKAVKQLQVSDITRNHFTDARTIIDLIQRVAASPDNLMGIPEEVKRTATETSSTINLATSRLKLVGKMYSVLGVMPWFKAMTFNNQHFLTQERYFRITDKIAEELGKDPKEIMGRVLVKPEELYGNFDFMYPNLDMPTDKADQARVWGEILKQLLSSDILLQDYSASKVFAHGLYALGIGNISEFRKRPFEQTIVSNETLDREVEKGNLVATQQRDAISGNAELSNQVREDFLARLGNTNGGAEV